MLKLKLQYFGHLMRSVDSLEKPWWWEGLGAGGEGDDRGWDGWMASSTWWAWVWVNSKHCRGGLLFRFACSVALWGGRSAADKSLWPVCGALAVFRPHWVCPTLGLPPHWVCSRSRHVCYTAQAPSCSIGSGPWVACGSSFQVLHKSADSVGPAFCAFPSRAAQAARSLTSALSPAAVHLPLRSPSLSFCPSRLGAPCVCFGELVSSCDPPGGCRPSRISGSLWLETWSLFAVW